MGKRQRKAAEPAQQEILTASPAPGGMTFLGVSATTWFTAFLGLINAWFFFFALVMFLQERKSIRGVNPLRFFPFVYMWMVGSLIGSVMCIPDLLLATGKARAKAHKYSGLLAVAMYRTCVGKPQISGTENLPPPEEPVIYVANHNSSIDIALFYHIGVGRRFSWVSKSSVFMVPGVGLIMRVAQYVALTRGSRDSVKQMFDACKRSLDAGWPVTIFPQGTRRRHKVLSFKDGAFKLAIETGLSVVPVSIYLPEDAWRGSKESGRLVIHKPIKKGDAAYANVETLKAAAFATVISELPYAKAMLAEQAVADAAAAVKKGLNGNGGSEPVGPESKKSK